MLLHDSVFISVRFSFDPTAVTTVIYSFPTRPASRFLPSSVKSRSFPSLSSSPASVNPNPSSKEIQRVRKKMQEQTTSSLPASSLPSSSERSSSSAPHLEIKEGIESDEEIRRVPEFGGEATGKEISGSATGQDQTQATVGGEGQRKRGRTPAEKETKRLKRLLRNRVSAQQARERKKAYLGELENRVKDLENRNSELEERLSTLQNENQMLRQILKNTTGNKRGSGGSNADASL